MRAEAKELVRQLQKMEDRERRSSLPSALPHSSLGGPPSALGKAAVGKAAGGLLRGFKSATAGFEAKMRLPSFNKK